MADKKNKACCCLGAAVSCGGAECCGAADCCGGPSCQCACCGGNCKCRPACLAVCLAAIAVVGAVGLACSFATCSASRAMFPDHEAVYKSDLFRPTTDHLTCYHYVHPFLLAVLVMLGMKRICCPGRVTLLWALVTLPGMLLTYSSMRLPASMVATWYGGSVLTVLAEAAAAYGLKLLCCKCCSGAKAKADKKSE
eukprot:TRINITY_DN608_c0_g1_i2.p1 TRINITY_DN608_c0_g1~~TRINITY_DN608_c0_g1_i2.p1  ORF type:complete len:195 (-),score=43.12 TRINITY_DN608_c0_g1_i2:215-799(-)